MLFLPFYLKQSFVKNYGGKKLVITYRHLTLLMTNPFQEVLANMFF